MGQRRDHTGNLNTLRSKENENIMYKNWWAQQKWKKDYLKDVDNAPGQRCQKLVFK